MMIDNKQINEYLDYPSLVDALEEGFRSDIIVPLRHHHNFANPRVGVDSTLLLMPAWKVGEMLGIKLIIVSPENQQFDLPSIQGTYLLFNAINGQLLLQIDAKVLTSRRTAAASALASRFLSRPDTSSMLLLGTGNLAVPLIEAHTSVRPINRVWVWGRRLERAQAIASQFENSNITVEPVESYDSIIKEVDLISTATLSSSPLIFGHQITAGHHIDLVGSFKPEMREADDEVLRQAAIYVDTLEGAPKECGDILQPLTNGTISLGDIRGDLFGLSQGKVLLRQNESEITYFKSVGHALEDLVAARLLYERLNNSAD